MSDAPDDPPRRRDDANDADDDDDDDDDDGLADALPHENTRGFASKMIGDLAKKALMSGIGAVFTSEEALKSQLGDMKLPKEAMGYVAAQADKTKKEIVNAISAQTREFLGKLEMDKVLSRVLSGTTIEIQTRIRILPKDDGGITPVVQHHRTAVVRAEDDKPKRKRRRRDDPG